MKPEEQDLKTLLAATVTTRNNLSKIAQSLPDSDSKEFLEQAINSNKQSEIFIKWALEQFKLINNPPAPY